MELECQNYCAMMCGFCVVVFSIDFSFVLSRNTEQILNERGVAKYNRYKVGSGNFELS